jgi:orotidine-5'-phosphate decarboxylase
MKTLLTQKIEHSRHPICIGFDPDITQLHPFLERQLQKTTTESFLTRWYASVVDGCTKSAHSIKFQSAFFEQFGAAGITVLKDMIVDAKRRGLFVILDAKRGDISTTMSAYGKAAFEHLKADALTILPWMGNDSLEAMVPWMKQGKGIYIVWLSSNAAGRRFQSIKTMDGSAIASKLFEDFYELAESHGVSAQTGWVLGATDLTANLIEKLIEDLPGRPHAFLCPGIGAQGATFNQQTLALSKANPATLFPVSRGLIKADGNDVISSWDDYQRLVTGRWQTLIKAWQDLR